MSGQTRFQQFDHAAAFTHRHGDDLTRSLHDEPIPQALRFGPRSREPAGERRDPAAGFKMRPAVRERLPAAGGGAIQQTGNSLGMNQDGTSGRRGCQCVRQRLERSEHATGLRLGAHDVNGRPRPRRGAIGHSRFSGVDDGNCAAQVGAGRRFDHTPGKFIRQRRGGEHARQANAAVVCGLFGAFALLLGCAAGWRGLLTARDAQGRGQKRR